MARLYYGITLSLFIALAATCAQSPAADEKAADAPKPLVTVMSPSANEFVADLKFMMGEGKDEEKALTNLQEILLDPFLVGNMPNKPAMDKSKPAGAIIYLEKGELQTVTFFPVIHADEFFKSIAAVGIESSDPTANFYEISGDIFIGHARLANDYVYFAESKDLLLRDLPVPAELFKDFSDKKYDVAAVIDGTSTTVQERREAFDKFRKETASAIKQMKEESELDFKIRKAALEFQLDEIERFFAESKRIELSWTTDVENKTGKSHIELEALPGTALAETIAALKQTDGKAAEELPQDYVTYGSSYFAFDELRKTHMLALSQLLRQKAVEEIDANEEIKPENKDNAKKVADLVFNLMDANTEDGALIGWLKVSKDDEGRHTLVGQMTIKDPNKLTTMLTDSQIVEMNVDTVEGKADIHKLKLYGDYSGLQGQFGEELAVYFAVGQGNLNGKLWIGMGQGIVDSLKKAVDANESGGDVAARLRVRVGSWVDALIDPEKKKPEEKPTPRRRTGRRRRGERAKKAGTDVGRIAWQVLGAADDDVLVFTLEKVGENRVVLNEEVDFGLLRFIGKVTAQEINANLK